MLRDLNRTTASAPLKHPVRVVQFGEGNFLRAFADWMVDILNEKAGFNGAVQLVQPIHQGLAPMINKQDGLYHVFLEGIKAGKTFQETRLITCVKGCINPYDDYSEFLALAENPDLGFLISNTTEAGISFDERDKDPASCPNSFPGKVTVLLYHRFTHFKGDASKKVIVIPCELIDQNGSKLKECVLQYASMWKLPRAFSDWVDASVFCNTLVDRIVPGFPKDTHSQKEESAGYHDALMVTAEPFHLWVIEAESQQLDQLKAAFPLHRAGLDVKFVTRQAPYRTRKVRILNGAHTTMVPVAYLAGLRTVREAMDNHVVGRFIREAVFDEIIPTLDLDRSELVEFANDVLERFRNPFIRHELISISLNSMAKYKVRVLPSVLEYVHRNKALPVKLVFSLAALIRFYKGEWNNEPIPVSDTVDVMAIMKDAWERDDIAETVRIVLSSTVLWEQDLCRIPGLHETVAGYISGINASGSSNFTDLLN